MISKFLKWIVGDVTDNQHDTIVYTLLGALPFVMGYLGSDDAAKYIPAAWLFYLKGVVGSVNAALATLKAYRSTGFAQAQQAKKNGTGHTEFVPKPATTNPS